MLILLYVYVLVIVKKRKKKHLRNYIFQPQKFSSLTCNAVLPTVLRSYNYKVKDCGKGQQKMFLSITLNEENKA